MVADLLEKLTEVVQAENRPRAGYFCTYTPVEILAAAGFAPARLEPLPEAGAKVTGFLSPSVCSFVRACLASVLEGANRDLRALVVAASCTAMMHLYSALLEAGPAVPIYLLDVPRQAGRSAVTFFAARLQQLAQELGLSGGYAGREILWETIVMYGRVRRVLRDLFGSFTGAGATERRVLLRLAGGIANERLLDILQEQNTAGSGSPAGPAILVTGCTIPDAVVSLVEECGVRVVVDESCSGLRPLLADEVLEPSGDDPFLILAHRYLCRAPCPRMSLESRLAYLLSFAGHYRIDGVIYFALKFCDFALHEFPPLRSILEARGLPVMLVEGEYALAKTGQMRTRIEAFLEVVATRGGATVCT